MDKTREYLASTNLVKNTIGMIIDYLTDPPVLPYIKELTRKTQSLLYDFDRCRYYSTFFTIDDDDVISERCILHRHLFGNWDVKYRNIFYPN